MACPGNAKKGGNSPCWITRAERQRPRAHRLEGRGGREPELLEPISPHECRHTFASLMIAAGVNAKALSSYLGHSSVMITFDRYGHLMPGNEDEASALLDAYLERADGRREEAIRLPREFVPLDGGRS